MLRVINLIEAMGSISPPSQTTPQPGDRLLAAIEAQTVAIERAMVKAFWTQLAGLTVIMSVAMTVFVVVVKAG